MEIEKFQPKNASKMSGNRLFFRWIAFSFDPNVDYKSSK